MKEIIIEYLTVGRTGLALFVDRYHVCIANLVFFIAKREKQNRKEGVADNRDRNFGNMVWVICTVIGQSDRRIHIGRMR